MGMIKQQNIIDGIWESLKPKQYMPMEFVQGTPNQFYDRCCVLS